MTRREWALLVQIERVKQGIKVKDLEKVTGLNRMTIWKALNGQPVAQRTLDKISDSMGVERIGKHEEI